MRVAPCLLAPAFRLEEFLGIAVDLGFPGPPNGRVLGRTGGGGSRRSDATMVDRRACGWVSETDSANWLRVGSPRG